MIDLGQPPFLFPRPAIIRPAPRELVRPTLHDQIKFGMLPGFVPMPVAATLTPVSCVYVGNVESTSDASSYSFSDVSLGTPVTTPRHTIIGVAAGNSSTSGRTLSGVTLGGTSMTALGTPAAGSGTGSAVAGLYRIQTDSTTTATVVVTLSAAVTACRIYVWSLCYLDVPTIYYGTSTADVGDVTVSTTADGCAVAVAFSIGSSAVRTHTWTGVTERHDAIAESSTYRSASAADMSSTTGSSLNVTVTRSGSVAAVALAVAAIR